MATSVSPSGQSTGEFVAMMAFLMSLVALAIDAVLPAFHGIGNSFAVTDENQLQLLVASLFLGLAVGQLLYGPLSDSIGRKPTVYIGLGLFIVGSLISAFANSFDWVLIGRLVQGFGVAAPRTICIAFTRDQYEGRQMARIMSFVITVFILAPALAPALGVGIMMLADWQGIFYSFALLSLVCIIWMSLRQPETHPEEKRIPFRITTILGGARQTLTNRRSLGYTIMGGLGFASLISYLNTAKLLYLDVFGIDEMFPVYFGMLALAVGAASMVNGKLVVKYGMHVMLRTGLTLQLIFSTLMLCFLFMVDSQPPFVLFMIVMAFIFFSMGIVFGNANALAMEPMGHIAGTASSVIGSGTTLVSMTLGTLIGLQYNHTVLPMIMGFCALSLSGLLLMAWIERK